MWAVPAPASHKLLVHNACSRSGKPRAGGGVSSHSFAPGQYVLNPTDSHQLRITHAFPNLHKRSDSSYFQGSLPYYLPIIKTEAVINFIFTPL